MVLVSDGSLIRELYDFSEPIRYQTPNTQYNANVSNTTSNNSFWNDMRIAWDGEKYILVCVDKPEKPKKEFNMELKIDD